MVCKCPSVHRPFSGPTLISMCSDRPRWKRLISDPLVVHERISLIMMIFSDPNQVRVVSDLSGDVAQIFVDRISEVSPRVTFCPGEGEATRSPEPLALSIRCWIVSPHRYVGSVCAIYTKSAATRHYFPDDWKSHFVTTWRRGHLPIMDLRTFGRGNTKGVRLQLGFPGCSRRMTSGKSRE